MKTMMRTNSVLRTGDLGLAAVVLAQWTTLACGKSSVQAAPAMPAPLSQVRFKDGTTDYWEVLPMRQIRSPLS